MDSKETISDSSDSFAIEIADENVCIQNAVEEEESLLKNEIRPSLSAYNLEHIDSANDYLLYEHDKCDSPITISYYGSREGSCNSSDIDDSPIADISNNLQNTVPPLTLDDISNLTNHNLTHVINSTIRKKRSSKFKKLDVYDIERKIDQYYSVDDFENRFTSEIDILTTYMKGQKNVYIQSKNVTQWKYNCLMFPILIISCFITISSPFIDCQHMRTSIISGLNAIIALFISIINFWKLESSTQSFFQLATHYDKLETMLELTTGRLLITEKEVEKKRVVVDKINEVEQKIMEIKDTSHFLIPEEVKSLFPIVCHINIFSFIKKMQNYRHELIVNLRDVKNESRYILHKWKKISAKTYDNEALAYFQSVSYKKEKARLYYLYKIKGKIKSDISEYKNAYCHLDELFTREIKSAENKTNRWGVWYICFWNYSTSNIPIKKDSNPIVDKYFHFIFNEDY